MAVLITAFNIGPIAEGVLGKKTAVLSLKPGEAVRLSKSIDALTDINTIETEVALAVTFGSTFENDAVFSDYNTPKTLDRAGGFYDVSINADGHPLIFTRLRYLQKNTDGSHDCEFFRGENHWADLAADKKINTIDLGSFTFNSANVIANWSDPIWADGNDLVYFPLIDYGGWVDKTEPLQGITKGAKTIAIEDFRPFVSMVGMLKQGFCEIGWTLRGDILETDRARSFWLYRLSPTYYDAGNGGDAVFAGRTIASWSFFPQAFFPITTVDYDPGSMNTSFSWIENPLPFRSLYTFCFEGYVTETNGTANTIVFNAENHGGGNLSGGEILSDDFEYDFDANETRYLKVCIEIEMDPGAQAGIRFEPNGFRLEAGYRFTATPSNKALTRGDVIEIKDTVSSEYDLLSEFKAMLHIFNARFETDWLTREIIVHPRRAAIVDGTSVGGFLQYEDEPKDLRSIQVINSIQRKPIRPETKRYTRVQFKESTDAYIDTQLVTEPVYSRKVLNGIDLPDDVTEFENPVNEPSMEAQVDELTLKQFTRAPLPFVPRLWDNTNGDRSFDIGPRILAGIGDVRQVNPVGGPGSEYSGAYLDGVGRYTFGYATMLNTWEVDPAPTFYPNCVFANKPNDLFVYFWLSTAIERKSGEFLSILMNLDTVGYLSENFRRPWVIDYKGRPLLVEPQSIDDFQAGAFIPTPVTVLAEGANSNCCDLPCGCSFTECEYYQDFGAYMYQSTLDTLKISSFIVDGIELIGTPVGFGLLSIIDIGGEPYVTNLVDTLNSIGAPYFSFAYSDRAHISKGLRFFKIKRPSCYTFSITIQESGVDVYLYTESSQGSKAFSGTYEGFGYNEITEPENCQVTKEYV